MNILKMILFFIVTLAFLGGAIKDWATYDMWGKLFMALLIIGFAGLTYSEAKKD